MTYLLDVLVHVASHLFGQLCLSCDNNQTNKHHSIIQLQTVHQCAKISGTLENTHISDLSPRLGAGVNPSASPSEKLSIICSPEAGIVCQ